MIGFKFCWRSTVNNGNGLITVNYFDILKLLTLKLLLFFWSVVNQVEADRTLNYFESLHLFFTQLRVQQENGA